MNTLNILGEAMQSLSGLGGDGMCFECGGEGWSHECTMHNPHGYGVLCPSCDGGGWDPHVFDRHCAVRDESEESKEIIALLNNISGKKEQVAAMRHWLLEGTTNPMS